MGSAALVAWFVIVTLAVNSADSKRGVALTIGGALGLPCIYLFLETHFSRIRFDTAFIYASSPWRGKRQVPWQEITGCDYSPMNFSWSFRTAKHGIVTVSRYRSGVEQLLDQFQKSTGIVPCFESE